MNSAGFYKKRMLAAVAAFAAVRETGAEVMRALVDIFDDHYLAWSLPSPEEPLFKGDWLLKKVPSPYEAESALLRDIFGNPFNPVTCDPTWRTQTTAAIAQTIYDERQFQDLVILADALEDAGCTDGDILNHCRQPGEHVRGCWVVDLILGKE